MTEDSPHIEPPKSGIVSATARPDQLYALLEHSTEMVLLLNGEGIIRYASPATVHVLDCSPHDIVGASLLACIHLDDRERLSRTLTALRATPGGSVPVAYRLRRQDGSWRSLEGVWTNRITDALLEGIVVNTQDVTEREALESNLRYLAHASRLLSSSLDFDAIWANLTALAVPHIADWCAVDILNVQGVFEIAAIAHREPDKVALVREFRQANPIRISDEFGLPVVVKTRERQWMPMITDEMIVTIARTGRELEAIRQLGMTSALSVPLIVRGEGIGAITFVTSESHRRLSEADVVAAEELAVRASLALENATLYAEARQAITVRDQFIAAASHELKTPITSLKMYTQVLYKQVASVGNTQLSTHLGKVDAQVGKLTRLINDLLDVTRIEHGQLALRMETIDLTSLTQEVVEQVRLTAPGRHFDTEITEDILVFADRDRLGQVITNLLTNALKFSPGVEPVVVRVTQQGETASVTIEDHGLGIDTEHQARIFERFYRVNDPHERTYPGLGIGLYIAYEIISRHGGTMRVESEKGTGSQFTFTLPFSGNHPLT